MFKYVGSMAGDILILLCSAVLSMANGWSKWGLWAMLYLHAHTEDSGLKFWFLLVSSVLLDHCLWCMPLWEQPVYISIIYFGYFQSGVKCFQLLNCMLWWYLLRFNHDLLGSWWSLSDQSYSIDAKSDGILQTCH